MSTSTFKKIIPTLSIVSIFILILNISMCSRMNFDRKIAKSLKSDAVIYGSSEVASNINTGLIEDNITVISNSNKTSIIDIAYFLDRISKSKSPELIFLSINPSYYLTNRVNSVLRLYMSCYMSDFEYRKFYLTDKSKDTNCYFPIFSKIKRKEVRNAFVSQLYRNEFTLKKRLVDENAFLHIPDLEKHYSPFFKKNKFYYEKLIKDSISRLRLKGVHIIGVKTPYNDKNIERFSENFISNLTDFNIDLSKNIPRTKIFFRDSSHLSKKGSEIFTKNFIEKYKKLK